MAEATLTSDTDTVGAGLGIIIDKLRNIETKLDELKTIDSESDAILAAYSLPEVGVTPTLNPHTQLDTPLTPSEETSSFRNDTTATTSADQSMVHYCMEKIFETEVPGSPSEVGKGCLDSESEDEKTLIVEEGEEGDEQGGTEERGEGTDEDEPLPQDHLLPDRAPVISSPETVTSQAENEQAIPERRQLLNCHFVSINSDSNLSGVATEAVYDIFFYYIFSLFTNGKVRTVLHVFLCG